MGYGSPAWAALVAQIRRDPANNELRDVAADYLIEHDDPRGEFIVLRGRLERGDVPSSEYVTVYDRYRQLEREKPWISQLQKIGFPNLEHIPPFGGFLERVTLNGESFTWFPDLCRYEPITRLWLARLPELSPALLVAPELDDVVELDLYDGSHALLASPNLGKVLDVSLWSITDMLVTALAKSIVRPHRLHLTTSATNRMEALYTLARSAVLDEVRELPIANDEGVDALGDHALPKLAHLDTTAMSSATIERLARNFDQLARLRAHASVIPTVMANVRSGNLRELSLLISPLDVDRVVELIDSQACLALQSITLRGLPLPLPIEQSLRKLAFHGHLREVTVESRRGGRIQIGAGVHVIEAA